MPSVFLLVAMLMRHYIAQQDYSKFIPIWQVTPVYGAGHVQLILYVPSTCTLVQLPLFKHGLLLHGFMSMAKLNIIAFKKLCDYIKSNLLEYLKYHLFNSTSTYKYSRFLEIKFSWQAN